MTGNAATGLRRRHRAAQPMVEFDRLPPAARAWLRTAILPWSARSVGRRWAEALARSGGDEDAACRALDALELRLIARDPVAVVSRAAIR